jgi:thiamine pyrophosphokinase
LFWLAIKPGLVVSAGNLMTNPRMIIFVNGLIPDNESARCILRPDDIIIAADGGTRHALDLDLTPSVIIGDLDSLPEADRRKLEEKGVQFIEHPAEKDQTDLELALDYAIRQNFHEIVLIGALGGRLDQTLGNLARLTGLKFAGLDVRADDGVEEAWFVRDSCQVSGQPGDLVSLIPWGRKTTGVTTSGLRWPLHGEILYPDKTRGISNELKGETATVSIHSGLLLVVHRRQSQIVN